MENQLEKTPEKGEIIAYHTDGELHLDVRLENETVWLTQVQIAELFGTKRPAITKHLKNIYASQELDEHSTCSVLEHMGNASQQVYETKYYNLDAILSVGYRVNSKNATLFRRWANQVLKDHLLKGYSINQRLMLSEQRIDQQLVNHENHLQSHDNRLDALEKQVDFFVKLNTPPTEGAIPAKSWWSGYEFAAQLVRSAKQEIIIIDPYADDRTLRLLAKKSAGVKGFVYSARVTRTMKEEENLLNRQNPTVQVLNIRDVHDRFIIVDETVYHVGASINDLGKQLTAFSVLEFLTKEQLLEMIK
ncbi:MULTISPECIES: RhuM family protein [unclassified Fibrobacter]|uniref:RhuM family protein n=1 Tax=unclassified Fibrobacter TaxID=2634177 RepID=UPI000D7B20B6|nr:MULTISPECIES: RhuM family protein [unclassified Fibrobacter]PWJ57788.1 virulence RhuM family protein [Fibrobacter sp. UWR4]PZW62756.1 virulence RhuM family protein [Fibrobacter sp. UWR1]